MKNIRVITPLCISLLSAPGIAETHNLYSFFESESYSEIAPIKQMLDDLKGSGFDRGDLIFTHNQFEVGERRGNWEVSAFLRYDYLLEFSNDAAELAYADKNDIELPKNRRFNVYIEPNHLRAKGLGVAYYFAVAEALKIKVRANYLRAEALTDGTMKGSLETLDDSVQADLQLDYSYSRDALLKREEERVRGNGLSLDVDLNWQFAPNWQLNLTARDLASAVWWRDVTYTSATAISDTINYDNDGLIDVKPAVSGIESYRDHRQTLPRRLAVTLAHQWRSDLSLSASLRSYDNYLFPRFQASWVRHGTEWRAGVDIEQQALLLGVNYQGLRVDLTTDAVKPEDAKAFGLSLSYQWLL